MVAKQFLHASNTGGDDRDLTGHDLPCFLGKAVSSEVVFAVADDGNIEGVKEDRHLVGRKDAEIYDSRQLGDLNVPGACENKVQIWMLSFKRMKGLK